MNHNESPSNNASDLSTIERCPHDSEHPYLQVSKALIRDQSLSASASFLIIYLLCNADKWKIKIGTLIKQLSGRLGREAIRSCIAEAVESGYMKREEYLEGGLKRVRYYLSEFPRFKKMFAEDGFPATGNPSTANRNADTIYKEEQVKENNCSVCSEAPKEILNDCSQIHPDGHTYKVTVQEIYTACIQNNKNWAAPEIEEAWEIFCKSKGPIRDWFKYIEATIENLRKNKISEIINAKKQGFTKCNQKTKQAQSPQTNPSPTIKQQLLVSDSGRRAWLESLSRMGLKHGLQNILNDPKTC